MRRLASSATLAEVEDGKAGPPLALRAEPLLHYGDPGRGIREGTLWAWGWASGGRAAAVMKVEYWPGAGGEAGHWGLAVGSLSPRPVSVEFPDRLRWASRKPGLEMKALPEAPAPAANPAQRLTQAKTLARRFAVEVDTHRKAGTLQLRLLPKPVDRYDEPGAGLVDGVIFALVHATNPITLLGLEARGGKRGASAWHYGFTRLGDGEATANLDGRDVWTVPFIDSAYADADLYMTRPMPEGTEKRE